MKRTLIALTLAGALFVAPNVLATTVLRVDVPMMTKASQWVVRAHVVSVKDVDLRAEGRGIFTDVELQIREVYRGQGVPARYTLRLPGGRGEGGVTLAIPGMPKFLPGEDVVLFLEKTSLGHIPSGLGQGVYRVAQDSMGHLWVRPSAGGVHMMERSVRGSLQEVPPPLISKAQLLADLVSEIYAAQVAVPQATPHPAPQAAPHTTPQILP